MAAWRQNRQHVANPGVSDGTRPREPRQILAALFPALLAGLFGAWCGTFWGGARLAGVLTAEALLLGAALYAGFAGLDPLGLGRAGRLLPIALWIAVAASAWASPVPRAGRTALALLPAFLLLPAAVARSWPGERERRIGLRALSAVVGLVGLASLLLLPWQQMHRAALPLGQHNLLAAWLVLLLPIALLPARERTLWRWLGWASGLVALAAVLASRSLSGALALAAEALLAAWIARRHWMGPRATRLSAAWRRGLALLFAVAVLALVAFQIPRLAKLQTYGVDRSLAARFVYLRGGWEGFLARPLLGHGPGSTPWTAAAFLRPEPGVNPPGEVMGELHALPLQLLFELGLSGGLLALGCVTVFARRRFSELQALKDRAEERVLLLAGLLGLTGGAVASLADAALAVIALPVAAGLAAGASLAAVPGRPAPARRGLAILYVAAALLALAPAEAARWRYERAIAAGPREEAVRHLRAAIRWDPGFPLYRARLALLEDRSARGLAASTAEARQAAVEAPGIALFHLIAGLQGGKAGQPWAREELRRACDLDPLAPYGPFLLAVAGPRTPGAPALAARALFAEPRLAAATFWDGRRDLAQGAAREVLGWEGVNPGYRLALAELVQRIPLEHDAGTTWLGLAIDPADDRSLSLHLFRRRPWAADWQVTPVWAAPFSRIDLPAATVLPSSEPAAFPPCAAGALPPS